MRQEISHVRDILNSYVERLLVLYERHDPRHPCTEFDKTAEAYQAIELCWRIMDMAAGWAQRHIIGIEYALTRTDEMKEFRVFDGFYSDKEGLNDSHSMLELAPLIEHEWSFACLSCSGEQLAQMEDVALTPLDVSSRRRYIANLTRSCSAGSYGWRNELYHALMALNCGAQLELTRPEPVKGQGNKYEADLWKLQAIMEVCFIHGQGARKGAARDQVANALGRDIETIRDWEKAIRETDEGTFKLNAAQLAGKYCDELGSNGPYRDEIMSYNQLYEDTSLIDEAHHYAKGVTRRALSDVRRSLDIALRGEQATPRAQ